MNLLAIGPAVILKERWGSETEPTVLADLKRQALKAWATRGDAMAS